MLGRGTAASPCRFPPSPPPSPPGAAAAKVRRVPWAGLHEALWPRVLWRETCFYHLLQALTPSQPRSQRRRYLLAGSAANGTQSQVAAALKKLFAPDIALGHVSVAMHGGVTMSLRVVTTLINLGSSSSGAVQQAAEVD